MTERTITSIYTVLIDRAESAAIRPATLQQLELSELNEWIEIELHKLGDGPRLIFDEEKLLARCCLRVLDARLQRDPEREKLWQQIVGVLLPHAREHFAAAIVASRRATTVSTTDQDYAARR